MSSAILLTLGTSLIVTGSQQNYDPDTKQNYINSGIALDLLGLASALIFIWRNSGTVGTKGNIDKFNDYLFHMP